MNISALVSSIVSLIDSLIGILNVDIKKGKALFIANCENGIRISAEKVGHNDKYFCSLCKKEVILKTGKVKVPHFAHKINSDCADWGDISEWHFNWQSKFPLDCREVVIEEDGITHRADVYIKDTNTVIEFQKSNISNEDIKKRNAFYCKNNRQLVWLFDYSDKLKDHINNKFDKIYINNEKDTLERHSCYVEWKRRQNAFFNVYDKKIKYYIEECNRDTGEKIILPLNDINEHSISVQYLIDNIYERTFLTSYGVDVDNTCKTIDEIYNNTRNVINEGVEEFRRKKVAELSRLLDSRRIGRFSLRL